MVKSNKKQSAKGSRKGGKFEREIAVKLSLWWTNGENEDVFWRTAGSGARARVRGKTGKRTEGQHGDLCATDPIGKPLTDLMIIELKNGYSNDTIFNILDKQGTELKPAAKQIYEVWIEKCLDSCKTAGVPYWCIIHHRNKRATTITLPFFLYRDFLLTNNSCTLTPYNQISAHLKIGETCVSVATVCLDFFLKNVSPEIIRTHMSRNNPC